MQIVRVDVMQCVHPSAQQLAYTYASLLCVCLALRRCFSCPGVTHVASMNITAPGSTSSAQPHQQAALTEGLQAVGGQGCASHARASTR